MSTYQTDLSIALAITWGVMGGALALALNRRGTRLTAALAAAFPALHIACVLIVAAHLFG